MTSTPVRKCTNTCIFCFVDQLPPDARTSLRVKDDDFRISPLFGNFVTLTNTDQEDLDRIVSAELSPMYVSVHATDPGVRSAMLRSPGAGRILEILAYLCTHGIDIHTQIVVCPGINDNEVLNRSVHDLRSLGAHIRSIGIVPVGLTRYRESLTPLEPVTRHTAQEVITTYMQPEQYLHQTPVYLADEFFISAGAQLPEADYYGDYPQLENGIGMSRLFLENLHALTARKQCRKNVPHHQPRRSVGIVTGAAFAPLAKHWCRVAQQHIGADIRTIPVCNEYLGNTVTVTGLLSGRDIVRTIISLKGGRPDFIGLPANAVNAGTRTLIDDTTTNSLEKTLGCPVRILPVEPRPAIARIQRWLRTVSP